MLIKVIFKYNRNVVMELEASPFGVLPPLPMKNEPVSIRNDRYVVVDREFNYSADELRIVIFLEEEE